MTKIVKRKNFHTSMAGSKTLSMHSHMLMPLNICFPIENENIDGSASPLCHV
uniref:Uncharacterized protein n=1 Tax=Rhizophora mucronata TaxID=61149 RepID=A0A2P2N7F8_RHIMU